MSRVLVTGSTGFVGRSLCRLLADKGYTVRAAMRAAGALPEGVTEAVLTGDINEATEWSQALEGADLVVHLAARVHALGAAGRDLNAYIRVNTHGTSRLASEAARMGVRRFVYVSTIKVNGEETTARAFAAADDPNPQDAYAQSKWLAEQHVREASRSSCMQYAIVRLPLVYGPGVRANFLRLMRAVDAGWPLPFGVVRNRRSLVSIWNVVDLLSRVLEHPAAAGATWMVSDGTDVSTAELVRIMGDALGRDVRLISIPTWLLRVAGAAVGHGPELARLCGSLVVDISETRRLLSWEPPLTLAESIARTAAAHSGRVMR